MFSINLTFSPIFNTDALRLSDTFSIGEPAQAQNPQQKTHLQKKGAFATPVALLLLGRIFKDQSVRV